MNYIELPLFSDPSYFYFINLEGASYKVEFYFVERSRSWVFDLSYADGTPIVLGERVVQNYPMLFNHTTPLSGAFFLIPIGDDRNYTVEEDYQIDKYFRLFYIYEEE